VIEILEFILYPLGLILEVVAIVHYFKTRPQMYWFYVIVFMGPLGSAIYLGINALPDGIATVQAIRGVTGQKRIIELEAKVEENPSAANYEELADVYMTSGHLAEARAALDKAIAARSDTQDAFYRRGLCALQLGEAAAAIPDIERVVAREPGYDFHRAAGMLALACFKAGQKEKAETLFHQAIASSTLSETYLNFADFLASESRVPEARQWAQKVLDKERTMPSYLRRRERPWFQKAAEMLKRLPA
jgi:hypothetical protein